LEAVFKISLSKAKKSCPNSEAIECKPLPDELINYLETIKKTKRETQKKSTRKYNAEKHTPYIVPRNELNNIHSRYNFPESNQPVKPDRDFREFFKNPKIAFNIIRLCGQEVKEIGQSFKCVLPGSNHSDINPSAALWQGNNGIITYHCFHDDSFWLLPEVYSAYITQELNDNGYPIHLSNGVLMAWGLRVLHELGEIKPVKIAAKELPKDTPPTYRKTYHGFIYLLELRAVYSSEQEGTPFAWRFAVNWCGVSRQSIINALTWLTEHDYIFKVKDAVKHGKQSSALYNLRI
jgi:hypothetical protein